MRWFIFVLLAFALSMNTPASASPQSDTTTSMQANTSSVRWLSLVFSVWEGYKDNYIFCGADCGNNLGLVFDPGIGYQAVSEGVGYGMLMAVMVDDQPTFDLIYDTAHVILLDTETDLFHWRVDNRGQITGEGSATDADQDIVMALIFAQALVDRDEWEPHPDRPYDQRARELLDAIWRFDVVDDRYVKPGDRFGGDGREIINLSYFSPVWYRLYDEFEGGTRWTGLIDKGYESLFATDGAALGLAPDWSTVDGRPAYDYCDRTGRPRDLCRYDMFYDAIRVPWRIGLDCLWFNEPRACDWSERTASFLNGLSNYEFARMYDMNGGLIVDYRDEAMLGMWLTTAVAAGDQTLQNRLENMLYEGAAQTRSNGYWGDSPHFYYNQSLAWFGASLVSGTFRDLTRDP